MAEKSLHEKKLQLNLEIELLKDVVETNGTTQQALRNVLVELRFVANKMKLDFNKALTDSEMIFGLESAVETLDQLMAGHLEHLES